MMVMAKVKMAAVMVVVMGVGIWAGAAGSGTQPTTRPLAQTQVILIGTLHSYHNLNPSYGTAELRQILLALKPQAICVELYSKLMTADGMVKPDVLADTDCPEVVAINDVAKQLNIRQVPFDREDRNENFQQTNYFGRQKQADQKLSQWCKEQEQKKKDSLDWLAVESLWNSIDAQDELDRQGTPRLINSRANDRVVSMKHAMNYRIFPLVLAQYPGYEQTAADYRFFGDEWTQRNRIMADNLLRIARQYAGKRIVVTTGAEHRYILRELLEHQPGIELKEYWEVGGGD